jgi:hypothetical protein
MGLCELLPPFISSSSVLTSSLPQRSTAGFPRPKQFEDQVRSSSAAPFGPFSPSPAVTSRPPIAKNQHTAQLEEINRTLSKIQFSRPSSAGAFRNSTSKKSNNSLRPQTANPNSSRNNNNNNEMTFDFNATHTQSMPQFHDTSNGTHGHLYGTLGSSSGHGNDPQTTKSFHYQGQKLPHYVATDKQVLRFFCHYYDSNTQLTYQPIRNFQSASTVRYITLHYFLEDATFEMFTDKVINSGIHGGPFYKRNYLKKTPVGGGGGSKASRTSHGRAENTSENFRNSITVTGNKSGNRNENENELLRIEELSIGGTFSVLGHDFFITDCDEFTREYYRRELGIQLASSLSRPPLADSNHGAANATGLQSMKYLSNHKSNSMKETKEKRYGTCSMDYLNKKQEYQKTQQFLSFPAGACLQFNCIEMLPGHSYHRHDSGHTSGVTSEPEALCLTGQEKQYDLLYSLTDDMIEVRTKKISRLSADEPSLLLKKTKLPKNWRTAGSTTGGGVSGGKLKPSPGQTQRPGSGPGEEWYTFSDFHIGSTVDVYGKLLLLVSCDAFTHNYYRTHLGRTLQPIPLLTSSSKSYPIEVPALGDGYLPIGSEEDTLHTVMGYPKPSKNWKKIQRNLGQIIRCRCKMISLSENLIDMSRLFHLTFYLEDDTLAIYEENIRNSGVVGGYYLKRGAYLNELPSEIAQAASSSSPTAHGSAAHGSAAAHGQQGTEIVPRPFLPTDIFLGNILGVNGSLYQVIEMDDMSVRFCEENSDEFPFFDTLAIIQHVIGKVLEKRIDLREYISRYHDTEELYGHSARGANAAAKGAPGGGLWSGGGAPGGGAGGGGGGGSGGGRNWITESEFVNCLEEIGLIEEMNDQEVMTVMRRFKEVLEGNMVQRKNDRTRGGGGGAGELHGGGGTARGSARGMTGAGGGAGAVVGVGAGGGEGRYFYHEFCDLFSYASFIENGKRPRPPGTRAKGTQDRGGATGGQRSVEKFDHLLDEMRGRLTQWRRSGTTLPLPCPPSILP